MSEFLSGFCEMFPCTTEAVGSAVCEVFSCKPGLFFEDFGRVAGFFMFWAMILLIPAIFIVMIVMFVNWLNRKRRGGDERRTNTM